MLSDAHTDAQKAAGLVVGVYVVCAGFTPLTMHPLRVGLVTNTLY